MSYTILHTRAVTIPAGTLRAAPLVTPTTFPPNIVDSVEWVFPDGCNGQVGIQIGARSVPILPGALTEFFIRSGAASLTDVEGMHDSGDWSVIGFNTGAFAHTVQVTFKVHRYQRPEPIPGYLLADLVGSLHGGG